MSLFLPLCSRAALDGKGFDSFFKINGEKSNIFLSLRAF